MASIRVFVLIPLVCLLSFTSMAEFKCSSSSTCNAIIDYVSPNATTISDIAAFFDVEELTSILGINPLPATTTGSHPVSAKQKIKIPFPCICSNGRGLPITRLPFLCSLVTDCDEPGESLRDPVIIVGVDEDIKTIEKQLVSVGSTKVVGICGANGLGKTTLAREVLKRGKDKERFDHALVWAFLGTEFRVVDVLKHISLKLLTRNGNADDDPDVPDLEEEALSEKISQILEEKRCLVVLNDLQNSEAWDCLRPAF